MFIAILGRQPALGMAELESIYGAKNTHWFSDVSALIESDSFPLDRVGGTQKAGKIVLELHGDWRRVSMKIVQEYTKKWHTAEGKITLGISAYGFDASPREVQKTGVILKQKLKANSISLRLLPNNETALNTATSHHNKLGLSENKVELIVIRARDGRVFVAESIGAQNITAYTKRDQERPKRDAFVGMLPPKLAQIMINLATPADHQMDGYLLDPFCGTGVILQEAALMGYKVYGTDLSDKMIDYSTANLKWLASTHRIDIDANLHQADAMEATWHPPIGAVACETYLGQPFSTPPSAEKLASVQKNCDHIIGSFLKNIGSQLQPGTPLCIAVPAWKDTKGHFTHLPLISRLADLGFTRSELKNVKNDDLLYYREDQVVARELLVLRKA